MIKKMEAAFRLHSLGTNISIALSVSLAIGILPPMLYLWLTLGSLVSLLLTFQGASINIIAAMPFLSILSAVLIVFFFYLFFILKVHFQKKTAHKFY